MFLELLAVASLGLAADETPMVKSCLIHSQLKSTAVIDDQTILFELRDRSVWVNKLRYRCPSLGFHESFSFHVRGNSICNVDTITVFAPDFIGATCGLSKFERVEGRLVDVRKELEAKSKAEAAAKRQAK